MNPDLLYALDLGFAMGLYATVHVLGNWALLVAAGQAGLVGKVGIMFGMGQWQLYLRKVGNIWLELGFLPGGYLQRRDDEMELYDSLFEGGQANGASPEQPPRETQSWQDLQAEMTKEAPAAYSQQAVEAPKTTFSVPSAWHALSVGLSLALVLICLVYAYSGSGLGEGLASFGALVPATIAQMFWIGDAAEWLAQFRAAAPGAHLVAWGMAWIILATILAPLLNALSGLLGRNSGLRKAIELISSLLAVFLFVRIIMLAADLTDSFWGGLGLYLLGGFAFQFVTYWVVLYVLRALSGKKA